MKNIFSIRSGLIFVACILTLFFVFPLQAGEKKKVTYTKESSQNISREDVFPGDNPKHKISQTVRIDSLTYSDPDFGSSDDWVYSQIDSVAGTGSHRGYTVSNYKDGDKTFGKYEGAHKTTVKENGAWEVNYEGKYQFTGGTGRFENIKGSGVYKGTITAKGLTEEGECEVEY